MSKKKRPKVAARPVPAPASPPPPEPRPVFHSERRPTPLGDYVLRMSIEGQSLVGTAIRPDRQTVQIARVPLQHPVPIPDTSKYHGVPEELDPALFREVLESCRQWVQDDVRRTKS